MTRGLLTFVALTFAASAAAAEFEKRDARLADDFRQLGSEIRDPNSYRNAAGAPGHEYWQQRADYKIEARLDEAAKRISATAVITYTNRSPDALPYLWLQLDQNRFKDDAVGPLTRAGAKDEQGGDRLTFGALRRHQSRKDRAFGFELARVADGRGRALSTTINDTMLRVDLAAPLRPGSKQTLRIDWSFNIPESAAMGSRGGYEWFEETDTYLYYLAQWFPRMVAYTDYTGWQHKQFIGRGEFTLEFGDYDVALTVPADHVVSATGVLTNPRDVLSATQQERLARARRSDEPLFIVTPEEALRNEATKASGEKTWRFKAENVRDFAWSSSRKFIWDAMIHRQPEGRFEEVLAMSFYPNEAEPIWSRYSTEAVVHTMDVYSRFSFPYPYPTAQSVNTWKTGGMEYPMITFNGYRPEPIKEGDRKKLVDEAPDRTYKRAVKHGLIGVIIHEIGHIYFPMVVNSDERQWTWMDEGINTFLEYLTELEWEENFHAFHSQPSLLDRIGTYMTSANQVPIMTQSDSILQFGPNAYTKPAAALVVLRETVMGRELFDFAFREYARRWRFKRPTPEDFFRTMEDASAVDLDWFWRGWFYSTKHVDIELAAIREYQVSSKDPEIESVQRRRLADETQREPIGQVRNREEGMKTRVERRPQLRDFYNENDQFTPSNKERNDYATYLKKLEPWERRALERALEEDEFVYFVDFTNVGGLISPLPLKLTFRDGTSESLLVPAEVWRRNNLEVTYTLVLDKRLQGIELDPLHQTADVDRSNNHIPRRVIPSRIELYKSESTTRDLMREMLHKLKEADEDS